MVQILIFIIELLLKTEDVGVEPGNLDKTLYSIVFLVVSSCIFIVYTQTFRGFLDFILKLHSISVNKFDCSDSR